MHEGKLSGSYVGGKGTRRTYRYEANYQRAGDTLCYSSKIWCESNLRAEPRGTISDIGAGQSEVVLRRHIHTSIARLANIDAKLQFGVSRAKSGA